MWDLIAENPLKILAGAVLIAITGGLAAPLIGGAIGAAMGLSGAAAVSAGLAFLGGGAIAAGGLGMAGGTVVSDWWWCDFRGWSYCCGLIHLFLAAVMSYCGNWQKWKQLPKCFLVQLTVEIR